MPRPKNSQRFTPQQQREQLQLLLGEALTQLRKQIKKADVNTLANFVTKTIPLILNENTQNTTDITFEILAQKAIKISTRIDTANNYTLASTDAEDEN